MKCKLALMSAVIGSALVASAYAAPVCSDWALEQVEMARGAGIATSAYLTEDLSQALTRYDIARILGSAYRNLAGEAYVSNGTTAVFSDVNGWTGHYMNELYFVVENGIMNGTGEGTFNPNGTLTRQEFAKIMVEMSQFAVDAGLQAEFAEELEELVEELEEGLDEELDEGLDEELDEELVEELVEELEEELDEELEEELVDTTVSFTDFDQVAEWAKSYVMTAVEKGYITGYSDGRFAPTDTVTWEQAYIILLRGLDLNQNTIPVITSHSNQSIISSGENLEITSTATGDVMVYLLGTASDIGQNGTDSVVFRPYEFNRNSKMKVVVEKDGVYSDPVTLFVDEMKSALTVRLDYATNMVHIDIEPMSDGTFFTLNVVERRTNTSSYLIEPREKLNVALLGATSYSFQGDYNRAYSITATSWNETLEYNLYTQGPSRDQDIVNQLLANGRYSSQSAAAADMVTVEFPIWKFSGSEKVASTGSVAVNPLIADLVVSVFEEIFEGPEQFPIYQIIGYAWRGDSSSSTHNVGIGIDLNANENVCYYANGTQVGSHWLPYEDPYSITPYGDVVRAFENHGFIWGGDAWGGSSPLDYMHFNYINRVD